MHAPWVWLHPRLGLEVFHDNDTARGWYERVEEEERAFYRQYMDRDGNNVAWDLIRACWASVATYALAPMQDFLDLGNEARMNYPGNPSGNWSWRIGYDGCSNFGRSLCSPYGAGGLRAND